MDKRFTKAEALKWLDTYSDKAVAFGYMYAKEPGGEFTANLDKKLSNIEDVLKTIIEELYNGASER